MVSFKTMSDVVKERKRIAVQYNLWNLTKKVDATCSFLGRELSLEYFATTFFDASVTFNGDYFA